MLMPLIVDVVLASADPLFHERRSADDAPTIDGRQVRSVLGDRDAWDVNAVMPLHIAQAHATPAARALRTPMSTDEARRHLDFAYRSVIRRAPEPRVLCLLLAQWALETGRGQSMWGFNFGGIKATSGGVIFDTRESFGARAQRAMQRFQTYRNAIEGAKHYIQTLTSNFPKAFAALQSGCVEAFVRALAEEGYFTGDPAEYLKAISRLVQTFERKWPLVESATAEAT